MHGILRDWKQRGQIAGVDLTFVDMRWGVRGRLQHNLVEPFNCGINLDEETLDHQTWIACSAEIDRCRRESSGLFFVSLQSEKYGYTPLPRTIDKPQYEERYATLADEVKQLSDAWYTLDTNSLTPQYLLKNLSHLGDNAYWGTALPTLRAAYEGIRFDTAAPHLLIGRSVTEWEVKSALLGEGVDNLRRSYWLHRSLQGGVPESLDAKRLFNDVRGDESKTCQLRDLIDWMNASFTSEYTREFSVGLQDLMTDSALGHEYKEKWISFTNSLLATCMENTIQTIVKWQRDGNGVGISGDELSEMLHHSQWAAEKCQGFVGRDDLLQKALDTVLPGVGVEALGGDNLSARGEVQDGDADDDAKGDEPDPVPTATASASVSKASGKKGKLAQHPPPRSKTAAATATAPRKQTKETTAVKSAGSGQFKGITLSIIGQSGSGKTALMAKLADTIYKVQGDNQRPVVIRFCGTSKGSHSGTALVRSICRQLHLVLPPLQQQGAEEIPEEFAGAVKHLHKLLHDYPVVLLIDSLDQLSNANLARSNASFLKGVKPHKNTIIVVSSLPDERDAVSGEWIYCYGCDTILKAANVPRIIVPVLTISSSTASADTQTDTSNGVAAKKKGKKSKLTESESAQAIIVALLAKKKRCLTEEQLNVVVAAASKEPTILYLNLSLRIISRWTSFQDPSSLIIQPGVKGIINQILDGVGEKYGSVLVRAALGFITFSSQGVSDSEIEDLLTLEDDVMKSVNQYNVANRLPSHVWLRVRGEIFGLITEREGGCLNWYHRQLREVAATRYTHDDILKLQRSMALYFGDLLPRAAIASKLVSTQPLVLNSPNNRSVWLDSSVCNHRRLNEASTHMLACGMYTEAVSELCNLEAICAGAKVGLSFRILEQLEELSLCGRLSSGQEALVNSYLAWLPRAIYDVNRSPTFGIHYSLAKLPHTSLPRQEMMDRVHRCKAPFHTLDTSANVAISLPITLQPELDAVLVVLEGLEGSSAAQFSPDGRSIAACSEEDNSILIWAVTSGEVTFKLEAHSKGVLSICYSPRGDLLASGSDDKTLRIWDVSSGTIKRKSTTPGSVRCVKFSPNGSIIAAIVYHDEKQEVFLFDFSQPPDSAPTKLNNYTTATCIDFSPDGSMIASGDLEGHVHTFDVSTSRQLNEFEKYLDNAKYNGPLSQVLFNASGSRIFSVGNQLRSSGGSPIVEWDTNEGKFVTGWCENSVYGCVVHKAGNQNLLSYGINSSVVTVGLDDKSTLMSTMCLCKKLHAISPDGKRAAIATSDSSHLQLVDIDLVPANIASRHAHGASYDPKSHQVPICTAMQYDSPTGSFVFGTITGQVKTLKVDTWEISGSIEGQVFNHGQYDKNEENVSLKRILKVIYLTPNEWDGISPRDMVIVAKRDEYFDIQHVYKYNASSKQFHETFHIHQGLCQYSNHFPVVAIRTGSYCDHNSGGMTVGLLPLVPPRYGTTPYHIHKVEDMTCLPSQRTSKKKSKKKGPVVELEPTAFAFAPSGNRLAVGTKEEHIFIFNPIDPSTGKLTMWSVLAGEESRDEGTVALCFGSTDDSLFSCSNKGGMLIWNVSEGCISHRLAPLDGHIRGMCYNSVGKLIASHSDYSVSLWDETDKRLITILSEYRGRQRAVGVEDTVTNVDISDNCEYIVVTRKVSGCSVRMLI